MLTRRRLTASRPERSLAGATATGGKISDMPRPYRLHRRGWERLGMTPRRMRRAFPLLLTTLLVFLLLVARLRPEAVSYQVGDIATRTIKATRAASYADPEATEQLRREAAAAVPDEYTRDPDAATRAVQTVHDVFAAALAVQQEEGPVEGDRVEMLGNRTDIQLSQGVLRLLLQSSPSVLNRTERLAATQVRQAMAKPIRSNTNDLQQARDDLTEQAARLGLSQRYREALVEIAQASLQPNQIYDAAATQAKREEARKQVPEVRRQLQPGDVLIAANETVTERHLSMFTAQGLIQPSVDYLQALSLLTILMLLSLSLALFVRRFANEVWADDQLFMILCFTLIGQAALLAAVRGLAWFEVIGISAACMGTIFLSLAVRPVAGAAAALYLGAMVSLASPLSEAHLLLIAALGALLASHFVRARESRSSTVTRSAILTALTNTLLVVVVSYVYGFLVSWQEIGYTAAGGFVAAILAAGVISMIERPLGLTTPLRLLEMQNPNEPLLRRLLLEAPGSYQSSVMVANIAEPAAVAVGADPVLTRTACMYHDIGKLKRSYFFVENQFGAENPHERLSPHLSALVLMNHVKDGLELAQEMKLPPVVASVIAQHHGTSLVSFMYQRAQQEAAQGEQVREADFRYPGPKPQTKENAIIMLADTVEASARAMEDPVRPRIEALVNKMVDARIDDGQLDESPLTFEDITIIKESFVNTVVGMFHQRLAYPEPRRGQPGGPEPERVKLAD